MEDAFEEETMSLARDILIERALLWDVEALALRSLVVLEHLQLSQRRDRVNRVHRRVALELALDGLVTGLDDDEAGAGFDVFGLGAGFSGEALARACRAHNRAGLEERRAFQGLVLEGRGLDDVAAELEWDGGRVARAARELLLKFFEEIVTPDRSPNDFGVEAQGRPLNKEYQR